MLGQIFFGLLIMTVSMGLFVSRLKTKVEGYGNRRLMIVDEAYTSLTCGGCGWLNKNLKKDNEKKSSKETRDRPFKCPNFMCRLEQDRDMNAARNILIRCLMTLFRLMTLFHS